MGHNELNCHLECPYPILSVHSSPGYSASQFPADELGREGRCWPKYLGPGQPCGTPRWSSGLLTSAWPSLGCWGHLRSEPAKRGSLRLSCHSASAISKFKNSSNKNRIRTITTCPHCRSNTGNINKPGLLQAKYQTSYLGEQPWDTYWGSLVYHGTFLSIHELLTLTNAWSRWSYKLPVLLPPPHFWAFLSKSISKVRR